MKSKKTVYAMTAAMALMMASGTTVAYGGWQQDASGYLYERNDGTRVVSGIETVNGSDYYFKDGYMQTGWQQIDGAWMYFEPSGAKKTGWENLEGKVYYLDPLRNGAMVSGWHQIKNSWYYFDPNSGCKQLGWICPDGVNWYYMNPENDGIIHTGWLDLGGERYYFESNGAMKQGGFQVGEFFYSTYTTGDKVGALIRNYEETDGSGSKIRYNNEGKAEYYDAASNTWYPFTGQNVKNNFSGDRDNEKIREIEYELYGNYRKTITKSTNDSMQAKKRMWKDKVYRSLQGLIPENEIESFIQKVETTAAKYDKYEKNSYENEEDVWRREVTF